ncbi:oligopeptide transporter-like protein [Xylogone sp. PMI_703]|nr:oligopeptide transporter-like protein [Xylogone sp. PMI_703]
MAPDRGATRSPDYQSITNSVMMSTDDNVADSAVDRFRRRNQTQRLIANNASEGQNFTVRGILVGLGVGLVICFSNMYFGLQTGWVSSMAMPSSLIGFAFFKTVAKHLDLPFSPVENVLVQTVAGSMGTMPLGCGFVGVIPALNYMLKPEEQGPLFLSLWKLILWSLGLCFFGVVFAVPLRKQVIIREKLKFPSGTATALMIGVLHGGIGKVEGKTVGLQTSDNAQGVSLSNAVASDTEGGVTLDDQDLVKDERKDWKAKVRLLLISFAISGLFTFMTYFFPILRNIPIFGVTLAETWLWALNPSLAYVGQGIIMGPATTIHMLIGAIVGWGILSPLAKSKGWAPGDISDWETGSKGWIVWISLAIMLADSVISLGHTAIRPLLNHGTGPTRGILRMLRKGDWAGIMNFGGAGGSKGYAPLAGNDEGSTPLAPNSTGITTTEETGDPTVSHQQLDLEDSPEPDAPPEHLVNQSTVWVGLVLSIVFCVASIRIVFGPLIPIFATITAVLMALVLSIMGVRALGETDLNPVSGISKLAQLFFALIIPQSNKNSVIINLVAGAVSEAGALQSGDLMQDLKTGHLVGAAPNAQFWGQIIGSAVGAVVSALIYKLYTNVYEIPGNLFQVPTGFVWIFTARLVTGKGLPDMAGQWALGAACLFTITTIGRIYGRGQRWQAYIPGGIAVAVGMYNVPSFTLARAVGGLLDWYWRSYRKREETPMVILASGLILGEGVVSILNLILASMGVPHM